MFQIEMKKFPKYTNFFQEPSSMSLFMYNWSDISMSASDPYQAPGSPYEPLSGPYKPCSLMRKP